MKNYLHFLQQASQCRSKVTKTTTLSQAIPSLITALISNLNGRCRLTIELADYSGILTLDLYDNDAEQLLPFTVLEIQELEDNVSTCLPLKLINLHLHNNCHTLCQLILKYEY